jgi:hypothetical protein
MRTLPSEVTDALAAGSLVARDFVWIIARDRDTGDPVPDGYWSDVGTTTIDAIDPETGDTEEREFFGAAGLIKVSDIPLVSNVTVQTVTVTLSQVADRVNNLVRTYDCKQAVIQVFRGLYDPDTREMVAPAEPRFAGFVDKIEIKTPAENEEGGVVMSCVSHTQEVTRSNPDTRSDASQKLRSATDDFFADAAVVGDWEMFWGKKQGNLGGSKKKNGGGG